MYIAFSSEDLIDLDDPGSITLTYTENPDTPFEGKTQTAVDLTSQLQVTLGNNFSNWVFNRGQYIEENLLPPIISEMAYTKDEYNIDESNNETDIVHNMRVPTEADRKSDPPIRINLNTDNNIAPGDYEIHFIFSYMSRGTMYQSK